MNIDDEMAAEERAYWTIEVQRRTHDVETARTRGDAPHLLAGADLRLREAIERLAAMSAPSPSDGAMSAEK